MYPKTMVFIATVGVSLSLSFGFLSIITWEIAGVLIAVFLGIPTLLSQVKIKPKEKEQKREDKAEKKKNFREESICVEYDDASFYDFDLKRGGHLKGEISSDVPLDIYIMNLTNFKKWGKDKSFIFDYGTENVYETTIDFIVPRKGTWFLTIENKGRKNATVKVLLFVSS